jgi:hypothetical protein
MRSISLHPREERRKPYGQRVLVDDREVRVTSPDRGLRWEELDFVSPRDFDVDSMPGRFAAFGALAP